MGNNQYPRNLSHEKWDGLIDPVVSIGVITCLHRSSTGFSRAWKQYMPLRDMNFESEESFLTAGKKKGKISCISDKVSCIFQHQL